MKKLGLLIMLAACIIVGGVYASWSYSEAPVSTITNTDVKVTVTDPSLATEKGTVSIHPAIALTIDDNNGDYKPEWDDAVTNVNGGNIIVRFTPKANSSFETVTLRVEVSITAGNTYGTQKIFNVENNTFFTRDYPLTNADSATIENDIIITFDEFVGALEINNNIQLLTYPEYEDYVEAVNATVITITVTEVTVP